MDAQSDVRQLDRDLAAALDRPRPAGATPSARYLAELDRRPPLSAGAERRLVEAAQQGDARARGLLIEAFLPGIAAVAADYRASPAIERIELMQEGAVGILRALERFNPEQGTRFWSYASWWVRQAMQQLVAELTRPVVLSDRALRQLARLKDAHRVHLEEQGSEPTVAEMATRAGLPGERVDDLLAADHPARSLEEEVVGDDGVVGRFGDLLSDPFAEEEYERVVSQIEADELRALLRVLSPRERDVIRARYGLDGPEQTLADLGARHGISTERVRQIETRGLGKLRMASGAEPQEA